VPAGRLFFLDISPGKGRLLSANPDGTDVKVLVEGLNKGPDGVAVDLAHGHIYWTNMGKASLDDGSIQRANLDGSNIVTIVPEGGTFTPKQLKLDNTNGKLYWSDREGMRVMRSNLDGSRIETLVQTGEGDADRKDPGKWCVGMALDTDRGYVYWTQKGGSNAGQGSLRRAHMEMPKGEDAAHRTDIEVLFSSMPEPIDLDLDLANRMIYWADRGDPPNGNTVNRAPMDAAKGARHTPEILVKGLKEGIGVSLDLKRNRMYYTDLGGNLYSAALDGSDQKTLLSHQGSLVGIEYVEKAK
jgi:DNA-binding beta-propeller fold protein YncE